MTDETRTEKAYSPLHRALLDALDDEYKARATYRAVIEAFGPRLPFTRIIESEQRHVNALLGLLTARGLPAMADPYAAGIAAPATFEESCRLGVQAEIDNVRLYDRLNAAAEGDAEVLWVFAALRRASQECHLPAFLRALEGGGAGAGRHGGGHGGHAGHGGCGCGGRRWAQQSAAPMQSS